jgi:hypothetical protein
MMAVKRRWSAVVPLCDQDIRRIIGHDRFGELSRTGRGACRYICNSNACFARATFSRIWLADLVQTKGLGSALWFSRYCMIAPFNLATLLKAPPADAVSGDLGKEALDHVEPGRRGGREVQVEARVCLEPAFHGRGLMRGLAVDDEVKVENRGDLLVNQLEKAQKLPVPMAWHARQDDLAVFAAKCLSRETLNVYQVRLPPVRAPDPLNAAAVVAGKRV